MTPEQEKVWLRELEARYWGKTLDSLHDLLTEPDRERRLWAEVAKHRRSFLCDLKETP